LLIYCIAIIYCMEDSSRQNEVASSPGGRRRGEPWAVGTILGYASANTFDDEGVKQANQGNSLKFEPPQPLSAVLANALGGALIGTVLRGLPSLALGVVLIWRHRTFNQLRPSSPEFIGLRPILAIVVAGVISTFGLCLYYLAMSLGGVTITVPVQETYVIWGTLIAWIFLHERIHRFALGGVVLIFLGLVGLSIGQSLGKPISPHWFWAIPLAFTTALTYGISGVLWRDGQLRGAHQSVAIFLQFITSMAVALAGLVVAGRLPTLHVAPWRALGAFLASGVLSGVFAIYCMFTALRLMAVARVYAFSSLTPLVATLFAHFFLHEFVNGLMLAGIVLGSIGVILTQVFRPKDERQA
jgi:drug/metabolite transporter (DMT)-like permease